MSCSFLVKPCLRCCPLWCGSVLVRFNFRLQWVCLDITHFKWRGSHFLAAFLTFLHWAPMHIYYSSLAFPISPYPWSVFHPKHWSPLWGDRRLRRRLRARPRGGYWRLCSVYMGWSNSSSALSSQGLLLGVIRRHSLAWLFLCNRWLLVIASLSEVRLRKDQSLV